MQININIEVATRFTDIFLFILILNTFIHSTLFFYIEFALLFTDSFLLIILLFNTFISITIFFFKYILLAFILYKLNYFLCLVHLKTDSLLTFTYIYLLNYHCTVPNFLLFYTLHKVT